MKYLLCFLLLTTTAHAQRKVSSTIPQATIERLKTLYPDQDEAFILERLRNAPDAFQKWRSFPPYYYELLTRLDKKTISRINARQGLCSGDPHLENFGFIYSFKPHFTLNDLDDVSLCSLNADLMRLLIGQRLVTEVSTQEFLKAYQEGMGGLQVAYPEYLAELEQESLKKKTEMSKKYKKLLEKKTCSGDFETLTESETTMLQLFTKSENKKFIMGCSRTKSSGGSAGSRRFIVFHESAEKVDVFELKPLSHPAPLFAKKISQKERELMFQQALGVFFKTDMKAHYYPVRLNETLYQRRPIWGGNTEIKADEMASKDLKAVMLYQARTLGLYHRITNTSAVEMSVKEFNQLVLEVEKKWKVEFGE